MPAAEPADSPLGSSPIVSPGRWTCLHGAWPMGEHSFICPFTPLEVKDLKVREGPRAFPEPTAHGALLSPHRAQPVTTQEGPGPTPPPPLRNPLRAWRRCSLHPNPARRGALLHGELGSHPTGSLSEAGTFLGSKPLPQLPASALGMGTFQGMLSAEATAPGACSQLHYCPELPGICCSPAVLRPLLTQGAHPRRGA